MTSEEFRDARRRLDWTQEDLAKWGGLSRRTIIRFENGQQPIPRIWSRAIELFEELPESIQRSARRQIWISRGIM
jgi:DNA-binding XRE family transcriptional regulator